MRRSKYNYTGYIAAILLLLFVIAGFVKILEKGQEKNGEGNLNTESPLNQEGQTEGGGNASVENSNIRVLLLSGGYQDDVHPEVRLAAAGGLKITAGEEVEEWNTDEAIVIAPDDSRFQKGNLKIEPVNPDSEIQAENIERGYGTPSYDGVIELRTTAEGIAMINELPLEDYLCRVVPSEMPASYEPEALKAQAVCARSYACRQMEDYAYPEYEAHVNDSTDYQVYNNSQPQDSSSSAVYDTAGQVVRYGGNIVTTYYYSTSCGRTTNMEAWGTETNEGNAYLQSVEVRGDSEDYEKDLPWYKWTAAVPVQTLSNLIGLNTGTDVGTLSSVEVTKKGPGDVALQIVASGDKGSVTVDTENKIRSALGGNGYQITKNDGTVIDSTKLLPSAFISIEKSGDQFVIQGGGYGHGIGMSQNGANEMAKQGKNYKEILELFYQGVTVE